MDARFSHYVRVEEAYVLEEAGAGGWGQESGR